MKTRTGIFTLAAATLVFTPLVGLAKGPGNPDKGQAGARAQVERSQHDFDRDRMRARDRADQPAHQRDRARDQDRTKAPETAKQAEQKIYGQELMSEQERKQYRHQIQLYGQDTEKRNEFMAQHRLKMQERAKLKGVELDSDSDDSD